MLDEQRASKSCGAETSVNTEYWKSKATSNPSVYSLRGIPAVDERQIVVNEVGQVKQTVTLSNDILNKVSSEYLTVRLQKPALQWASCDFKIVTPQILQKFRFLEGK